MLPKDPKYLNLIKNIRHSSLIDKHLLFTGRKTLVEMITHTCQLNWIAVHREWFWLTWNVQGASLVYNQCHLSSDPSGLTADLTLGQTCWAWEYKHSWELNMGPGITVFWNPKPLFQLVSLFKWVRSYYSLVTMYFSALNSLSISWHTA